MTKENASSESKDSPIVWIQKKVPRIGVWFAVVGSLVFALSEGCAKLIALDVSAEVIICVRYVIHGFATSPFLFQASSKLPGVTVPEWFLTLAGGFAAGATTYIANYSYHYIPLLDSFVLVNSQPVFAAVIAWVWLKEKLTLYDFCIIILTLIGVVVACQPTFIFGTGIDAIDPTDRTIGSVFALGCALFMAITTTITRKLKDTPSQLVVYLQAIGGTSIGFVGGLSMGQLYLNETLNEIQILALVFAGILGFLARSLFAFAVQTEEATLIAVLQTLEIPFSFVTQMIMLNTFPNSLSVIGAITVMAATSLLAAKKNVKNKARYIRDSFKDRIKPLITKRNSENIKKIEEEEEKQPMVTDKNSNYGTKG